MRVPVLALAADEGGGVRASRGGRTVRWVQRALSQRRRLGQSQRPGLLWGSAMRGDCQSGKSSWRREGLGLVLLIKNDDGRGRYSDSGLPVTHRATSSCGPGPLPCLCAVPRREGRSPGPPSLRPGGPIVVAFFSEDGLEPRALSAVWQKRRTGHRLRCFPLQLTEGRGWGGGGLRGWVWGPPRLVWAPRAERGLLSLTRRALKPGFVRLLPGPGPPCHPSHACQCLPFGTRLGPQPSPRTFGTHGA